MQRRSQVPGNTLRENFSDIRQPESSGPIGGTITNYEETTRSDVVRQTLQKGALVRGWEIVKHVKKQDVSGKRKIVANIAVEEINAVVIERSDVCSAANLSHIAIQSRHLEMKTTLS